MKQIAFILGFLCTLHVYSQTLNSPRTAPGIILADGYGAPAYDSDDAQAQGVKINEMGVLFGQDFPSGDKAHMYLEGRLGLSHGKHLWALAYGLSNPWDFSLGGSPNVGNTSILSAAYGQSLNLFQGIETKAYLGLSYLTKKIEDGHETSWGLPLTLVIDKPILPSLALGLIGQLQPTSKKGRALIGLKLSYNLNRQAP